MDNQRDFYIKEKFKQDDLISKKAEDVFNNFFKGEIKMEEEKSNVNEKVVDINSAKDKKFKMKKLMSMVATLVVVFLGVNVYAASQGYNNIFFIIRNLVSPESATSKEEILSDRDITISYQPIEIADNLNIQVNGLIIKENKATLYLKIDEKYPLKHCPKQFLVYDITDGRNDVLEKQVHLKVNDDKTSGESSYTEEIEMLKFKNDTKKLRLEISDQEKLLIAALEIDLENKSIDVLSSQNNKLQKLSETELKEVLGYYANLLAYDAIAPSELSNFDYSREEAMQAALVENAMLLIVEKEGTIRSNGYSVNELHGAIKEICGVYFEEPIELSGSLIYYDKERKCYDWDNGDGLGPALCLAIQDISFYNGIYTIDYVYCYAGDGAYLDNSIEELDKYRSTIQLSLNKDYKYAKYCINNFDEMTGELYTEENYEINDTTDDTIENEIIDDNTNNSNTNITVPVKPGNLGNSNEDAISGNPENSASTIAWTEFFTPGLRGKMPTGWNIKEFINGYSGPEDDGKLAKSVSGTITGIDSLTNKEVTSNVIINFYMPEFINVLDTETYTRIVASRYNMEASWAGYTSSEGMDWKMVVKENDQREVFCHLESLYGNTEGIGYVVEVISDNFDNDKLINVLYRIFMELRGVSF